MSAQNTQSNLTPVEVQDPSKTNPPADKTLNWRIVLGTIFALILVVSAIIPFLMPSFVMEAMSLLRARFAEAIFSLFILVALLGLYAIYQQVLIKRLRRQLADKQDHSQILRNLAMVDQLTGLYNRRFAEQRLAAEVSRSSRNGQPLTVVVFDLNHFKMINDKYGHPAGDMVLRQFAAHLGNAIRVSDFAARMGGDEFLLVLPECSLSQIQLVLSRIGPLELDWQGRKILITWSTGWNEYKSGERPDELLSGADQALYGNKRASKKSAQPEIVKAPSGND